MEYFHVMKRLENKTWGEIRQECYGYEHKTCHHSIDFKEFKENAGFISRYFDTNIPNDLHNGEVFSLRITPEFRVYGILSDPFYIIWIDPNHRLYPVSR
ncbi:MAG: hypothetical protein HPY53_01205 [Brevinematales bacterium]|nr:hypothetical protein [Brevinematales bacterium]